LFYKLMCLETNFHIWSYLCPTKQSTDLVSRISALRHVLILQEYSEMTSLFDPWSVRLGT
jgi:hypothetical protein